MSALAELPDEDGKFLPAGNRLLNLETLRTFMHDLHETIVAQILEGRTRYCEIIDGRRVIFQLPQANQLHDFVSFQVEDNHAFGVVLMIPSTHPRPDGEYDYHSIPPFEYMPPEPSDYLYNFSKN
ncbi:MAG: hypothetical protein PHE68_04730 [Candidatus Peribacteraceae bacterium]|nr:hypothetical protein [Candidatus Peribacteraceae bacterium]